MNKKQIKTLTSVIVVIIALAVGYFGSGRLHLGQGNNSATDNRAKFPQNHWQVRLNKLL